ncbi:hypothetical protein [Halococcus salifodinae]|nr:hypothetical protein [Halococcus salifodinae]
MDEPFGGKARAATTGSEQDPGGGWDGASSASAGGGGSQMVEGAKRGGATDLLSGAVAVSTSESRARNAREGSYCVVLVAPQRGRAR